MAKKPSRILTIRNGYWSKKINGKTHYFGKDYDEAVDRFVSEEPYLRAGLAVPAHDPNNVGLLLDTFLSDRKCALESHSLSKRTYDDYVQVCEMIAEVIPVKTPLNHVSAQHFQSLRMRLAKGKAKPTVEPKSLDRRLGYARAIFRFASIDNLLIDRPLPFTRALRSVSRSDIRRHQNSAAIRLLDSAEIRKVLKVASCHMRAAIFLSINGGLNNSDIAHLPYSAVSPSPKVLIYPRHKTHFMRQVPLWPETIAAIEEYREVRPESDLPNLFISPKQNRPFADYHRHDQISKAFYRYLVKQKIYQPGKNFGALRTTFANVGQEVGDDVALKALMGHSDGSSLYENYARNVFVPRLEAITSHVRAWLFN